MKRTLLAAALAALSTSAFAQAPSGEWKGTVSLGASFAQGYSGTKNTNFSLAGETSRTTTADKIAFYATTLYAKTSLGNASAETANNFKVGGRYEWNLSPQLYAFGALDFETDKLAGLDLRSAFGAGLGYYVIKSDPLSFTVFGGLGIRQDKYTVGSDNFTELLLGEESTHKLSENVSFKQRLVVYPNLSDSGETRASFDAGLSVKLDGAWNLNVAFADRYDSTSAGRKHDTLFLVGVGAKFGK